MDQGKTFRGQHIADWISKSLADYTRDKVQPTFTPHLKNKTLAVANNTIKDEKRG